MPKLSTITSANGASMTIQPRPEAPPVAGLNKLFTAPVMTIASATMPVSKTPDAI